MSTLPPPILEMRNISKTFGPIRALRDVKLTVWPGEVHALMGENGAGKSTLMKILSGAQKADPGGRLTMNGKEVSITSPADARRLGVAVIYQELSLAPNLTVAENVGLGREARSGGFIDRKTMRADCASILKRLGAPFGPDAIVAELSIAQRQLVEIARALSLDARILVMDEPTTALSSRETDKLFALVRQLQSEGLAIIYISHRMSEVYELADRCSVLRDGSYIGTLAKADISSRTLVKMMVGRDLSDFYKKEHQEHSEAIRPVLDVERLTDGKGIGPCSFALYPGEVVGLAGLVGAGRTELARLIYGADRSASGSITLNGDRIAIREPAEAIRAGLVYLTEDRKAQGLFLDMSIDDNVNISVMGRDSGPLGMRRFSKARERVTRAIGSLRIRAYSPKLAVGGLSGGNQQKVLLARLLEVAPKVLILDEPTRGVDIGAKSDIYKLIDRLAADGAAVLMISSELPEVVGLADRVLVMRDGNIVGSLKGEQISQEAIIEIATGDSQGQEAQ
ncbi:sugar ABC transporter ATP-binding protein [Mesorhizobium sp. RP14(2022)]|uniref:Sugar ABC transporter ATP-binding protein n=1 Tax=Mesorhizobium liriopis TaxID=2953882 RepID=A0ABT1C8M2_9HYPH|nr:sugar ABC transporter ATP-binding protein [Mesorhizobium liriopis]MCO6050506.1 sugar ABC transporter ATP-binding protein [Mesorhizobium liriopis]